MGPEVTVCRRVCVRVRAYEQASCTYGSAPTATFRVSRSTPPCTTRMSGSIWSVKKTQLSTLNEADGAFSLNDILCIICIIWTRVPSSLIGMRLSLASAVLLGTLCHRSTGQHQQNHAMVPQVQSLACVHEAKVSVGEGRFDFEADAKELKPDIYFCNEDASCLEHRVDWCKKVPPFSPPVLSRPATATEKTKLARATIFFHTARPPPTTEVAEQTRGRACVLACCWAFRRASRWSSSRASPRRGWRRAHPRT